MDWQDRLYTATMLTKIGEHYFIVDCWHHRIIFSENLYSPIKDWKTLDSQIAGPHSIAGDGEILVADCTGYHRLHVYRRQSEGYEHFEVLERAGHRPHRVIYCSEQKLFLVIGSRDQRILLLRNEGGILRPLADYVITELGGQYTRSITLHNGRLFAVGNETLVELKIDDTNITTVDVFTLHADYCGANDLYFLGEDSGILTRTPLQMTFFDRFDQLTTGTGASFRFDGTPYFLSQVDGMLIMPQIKEHSKIVAYEGTLPHLSVKTTIGDSGPATAESIDRKSEFPI
jgi:hypothetical protein